MLLGESVIYLELITWLVPWQDSEYTTEVQDTVSKNGSSFEFIRNDESFEEFW